MCMQAHHVKYEARIQKRTHPQKNFSFFKESSVTNFTTVKKTFSFLCCDFMKRKAELRELQNRYNKNYTSLPEPAVCSLRYLRCWRLFINESEAFVTEKSPFHSRKSRHRRSVFRKRGRKHVTSMFIYCR